MISAAASILLLLCTAPTRVSSSHFDSTPTPQERGESGSNELENKSLVRKRSIALLALKDDAAPTADDYTMPAVGAQSASLPLLDANGFPPFPPFYPTKDGVTFSRTISSLDDKTQFSLAFLGDHCSSKDSYGNNACHYNWGDTIEANVTVDLGTELDEGDMLKGQFKADHVIPYTFTCSVCGEDCVLTVPVVKVQWRFQMLPCPVTTGMIVDVFKREIGDRSPTDGVPTHLAGNLQIVKKDTGENVAQFSVSVDIK